MKHTGSCHCQKVRFEIDAEIDNAITCNCSLCSRRGHVLTFVPAEKFTLIAGEDALTDYQFNKKVLHHYFCSTCGVAPFGKGVGQDGKEMRAINLRCLEDFDIEKIAVTMYNGKDI